MNIKRKSSILFAWLVRSITFFMPDIPIFMRLRGFLYGFLMNKSGINFQVAHSAILNSISSLSVGNNVYIANNCTLFCGGGVIIGNNVIIAPNVVVSSNNHSFDNLTGYRFGKADFSPVNINKNSWICANVTITGGSTVPSYCIVGPGSTFIKSSGYRRNALYSGVPAKVIKELEGL